MQPMQQAHATQREAQQAQQDHHTWAHGRMGVEGTSTESAGELPAALLPPPPTWAVGGASSRGHTRSEAPTASITSTTSSQAAGQQDAAAWIPVPALCKPLSHAGRGAQAEE